MLDIPSLPAEAVPGNLVTFYALAQARAGAGHYQASMYRALHQTSRLDAVVGLAARAADAGAETCLEVGCCEGVMTARLAPLFEHVLAVDFVPECLAACPTLASVTYEVRNAEVWSPAEPVDVVVISETLEHLRDPLGVLTRLTRQAGWAVLSVPTNEIPNPRTFEPRLLGDEAVIGDAAGHIWSFRPGDLTALAQAAGLTILDAYNDGITEYVYARR